MAGILPNPFALKSNSNHRYLCCGADGLFQFTGQEPTSFFTTENGQTPGTVHVKCAANGKYWVRAPDQTEPPYPITCTADTPHEPIDEKCTLFEFEIVQQSTPTEVVLRIRHVETGRYLRPINIHGLEAVLCAVDTNPDATKVEYLFTAVGRP